MATWHNSLVPSLETESRPYGGVSAAERRARRLEKLRAAGLELFGTRGYAATSVRDICEEAGLNRRYFYEAFETREDLLRDVYDQLVTSIAEHLVTAVTVEEDIQAKVRAGLRAFWERATQDTREARILTIEIVGVSEALEQRRREVRHGFADFIHAQAIEQAERHGWIQRLDLTIAARALVAATIDLVVDWMRGDTDRRPDELADAMAEIFAGTARSTFVTPSGRIPAQFRLQPIKPPPSANGLA